MTLRLLQSQVAEWDASGGGRKLRIVFAAIFFAIFFFPVAFCQGVEPLGAYSRPGLERQEGARAYLAVLGHDPNVPVRGTELSPRLREFEESIPGFSQALNSIGRNRAGVGYAVFISRLEHDIVPVALNTGHQGYSVRIYVTLVLDMFADRAAFSIQNRLESVYTAAASDAWLFPEGALVRERPSEEQIAQWYDEALWKTYSRLGEFVSRDEAGMRGRASRVFQVRPVRLSEQAAEFLRAHAGKPEAESLADREILSNELAYMLHERISRELLERGRSDLAILPPDAGWAIGPVGRLIADRMPVGHELAMSVEEVGRAGLSLELNVIRAGLIDGERNQLGAQQLAASRIEASIVRDVGERTETRPIGLPESERIVVGRGAGRFLALRGIDAPPIRGMWREGYLEALDASISDIVDRMIQTSEELG